MTDGLGKLRAAVGRFKASAAAGTSPGGGMLQVQILDDSKANGKGVDRIFDALDATIDDFPEILRAALPAIRDAHRAVFTSEGSAGRGPWDPLSPRTLADRRRKGFPSGPILVRTGALRSHVLGTPARITRTGRDVVLEIRPDPSVNGVRKYRALAKGYPPNNLPGRPMVAVGPTHAVKITSAIQRALRARAAANGLGS